MIIRQHADAVNIVTQNVMVIVVGGAVPSAPIFSVSAQYLRKRNAEGNVRDLAWRGCRGIVVFNGTRR